MEQEQLQRIIEAILFAAGESVELSRLAMALETDPQEVRAAADALADSLAFDRRGIRIVRLEDAYQMVSSGDGGLCNPGAGDAQAAQAVVLSVGGADDHSLLSACDEGHGRTDPRRGQLLFHICLNE